MEAKLYKLTVYESSLEWTHKMGHDIWEIYLVQAGIVFNEAGGIFRASKPRAEHWIEIDCPYKDAVIIDQAMKHLDQLEETRKELFNNFKKLHGEAQRDPIKEKLDAWIANGSKGDLDLTIRPDKA